VREGGNHPEVDALYEKLNGHIMATKTAIAREALATIAGQLTGDTEAAARDAHFSRNAGCRMCPCSPGVVIGAPVQLDGQPIDVWVEPLT